MELSPEDRRGRHRESRKMQYQSPIIHPNIIGLRQFVLRYFSVHFSQLEFQWVLFSALQPSPIRMPISLRSSANCRDYASGSGRQNWPGDGGGQTAEKERAFGGLNPEAAYTVAKSIRKSSICFPDLSCAVSQRGFFPRPVQVSEGCSGFRNFGKTVG
jgi:hypothetical protein